METISELLALYEWNPPVTGVFPSQRANNAGFDVFINVSLNKRLNKQMTCLWFETPSRLLWRRSNVNQLFTPLACELSFINP